MRDTKRQTPEIFQLFMAQAHACLNRYLCSDHPTAMADYREQLLIDLHNLKDGFLMFKMNRQLEEIAKIYRQIQTISWADLQLSLKNILTSIDQKYSDQDNSLSPILLFNQLSKILCQPNEIKLNFQGNDQAINTFEYPGLISIFCQIIMNSVEHGFNVLADQPPQNSKMISITLKHDESYWYWQFQDNGIGLLAVKKTDYQNNWGVGLIACQKQIKALGGAMSTSYADRGCCVRLKIPRKQFYKISA